MSELTIKILELIEKKYTINEIINELNISRDQLYKIFRKLKQMGMDFNKKYYSSGDFIYLPNKEIYVPQKNNHVNLITHPGTDNIRLMLLSDLHIGREMKKKSLNIKLRQLRLKNLRLMVQQGHLLLLKAINIVTVFSISRCTIYKKLLNISLFPQVSSLMNVAVL